MVLVLCAFLYLLYISFFIITMQRKALSFSALRLLVGCQEERAAWKN